jgi:outer membrane protein TolC
MKTLLILLLSAASLFADGTNLQLIDLPTALKLAGAQNRDIQIARARLAEARANADAATLQFFPWIAPGVAYRAHDNAIQDVAGAVINVHKDAYSAGPALTAQLDLGDAIYKRLAAIQLAKAAEHAAAAQQAESTLAAASAYFDLARAEALIAVSAESIRLSEDYARQLDAGVEAGVTFKGDALRARVQAERNKLTLRQAQEQRRVASARLSEILRLPITVELTPQTNDFIPITLVETNTALDTLVAQALAARPELLQTAASLKAAQDSRRGAIYGPLLPTVGAQAFIGGLGGGNQTTSRGLSESEDYQITATWRFGPGGIFDRPRARAADARLTEAQLNAEKIRDEILRQVIESFTRAQSEADKLQITRDALASAEAAFRLARERKESAVGVAFEAILAEEEFTRLRQDYINTLTDHNKSQYALSRAIGQLAK